MNKDELLTQKRAKAAGIKKIETPENAYIQKDLQYALEKVNTPMTGIDAIIEKMIAKGRFQALDTKILRLIGFYRVLTFKTLVTLIKHANLEDVYFGNSINESAFHNEGLLFKKRLQQLERLKLIRFIPTKKGGDVRYKDSMHVYILTETGNAFIKQQTQGKQYYAPFREIADPYIFKENLLLTHTIAKLSKSPYYTTTKRLYTRHDSHILKELDEKSATTLAFPFVVSFKGDGKEVKSHEAFIQSVRGEYNEELSSEEDYKNKLRVCAEKAKEFLYHEKPNTKNVCVFVVDTRETMIAISRCLQKAKVGVLFSNEKFRKRLLFITEPMLQITGEDIATLLLQMTFVPTIDKEGNRKTTILYLPTNIWEETL